MIDQVAAWRALEAGFRWERGWQAGCSGVLVAVCQWMVGRGRTGQSVPIVESAVRPVEIYFTPVPSCGFRATAGRLQARLRDRRIVHNRGQYGCYGHFSINRAGHQSHTERDKSTCESDFDSYFTPMHACDFAVETIPINERMRFVGRVLNRIQTTSHGRSQADRTRWLMVDTP